MQRSTFCFPILSLPELVLMAVIKRLNRKDRWSLASSCRALAIAVSAALPNTQVTVTSKTRWKGLCKLLTTNAITVKALSVEGDISNESPVEDNALNMLMNAGAEPVLVPCFQGIEGLSILEVKPLPCLLPPNLVRVLPSLKELRFVCDLEQFANPQPIPYCSSLSKLGYMRWSGEQQLPSMYHTAEDVRKQLPNITSLVSYKGSSTEDSVNATPNCMQVMLKAWGDQLTELDLASTEIDTTLQQCTRLQLLEWYMCHESEPSTSFLPQSLTNLNLMFRIRESDLQAILQLPVLSVVAFNGIKDSLQQDWSNHPCTWQQLTIYSMKMVELTKLPLHSLKGSGCLNIERLEVPNPLLPNSLTDVTHAARCIKDAGIMIDGCCDLHCGLWHPFPVDIKQDTAMVDLVHAASCAVTPFKRFTPNTDYLSNHPMATKAVVKWMSHSLQRVDLNTDNNSEPLPWFWEALQYSCNLETVNYVITEDVTKCFDHLSTHVQLAAEHYVTVTGRQLTFIIQLFSKSSRTEDMQAALQHKLQERLPSTVKLWDVIRESDWKLTLKIQPS